MQSMWMQKEQYDKQLKQLSTMLLVRRLGLHTAAAAAAAVVDYVVLRSCRLLLPTLLFLCLSPLRFHNIGRPLFVAPQLLHLL